MTEDIATGIVDKVTLYESTVGVRDRCIAFLNIDGNPRMFVFDADVRDHLPVGRRVQLRFRPAATAGEVTLLDRKLL